MLSIDCVRNFILIYLENINFRRLTKLFTFTYNIQSILIKNFFFWYFFLNFEKILFLLLLLLFSDIIRCFCNLPSCISTGYMCKSKGVGCFSNFLDHGYHPSRDYRGRHGCLEHFHHEWVRSMYKTGLFRLHNCRIISFAWIAMSQFATGCWYTCIPRRRQKTIFMTYSYLRKERNLFRCCESN